MSVVKGMKRGSMLSEKTGGPFDIRVLRWPVWRFARVLWP